jgi:hypothetical protein
MRTATIILAALLLQGCVTTTPQETAHADFGAFPINYQERVRTYMNTQIRLRPETAIYDFNLPPRKGYYQRALLGTKKRYGWIVHFKVSVKNHFGFRIHEEGRVILYSDGTADDCTEYFGQLANYVD